MAIGCNNYSATVGTYEGLCLGNGGSEPISINQSGNDPAVGDFVYVGSNCTGSYLTTTTYYSLPGYDGVYKVTVQGGPGGPSTIDEILPCPLYLSGCNTTDVYTIYEDSWIPATSGTFKITNDSNVPSDCYTFIVSASTVTDGPFVFDGQSTLETDCSDADCLPYVCMEVDTLAWAFTDDFKVYIDYTNSDDVQVTFTADSTNATTTFYICANNFEPIVSRVTYGGTAYSADTYPWTIPGIPSIPGQPLYNTVEMSAIGECTGSTCGSGTEVWQMQACCDAGDTINVGVNTQGAPNVYVFYDGTSLDSATATEASKSIRSWFATQQAQQKVGELYEGVVGENSDNGEDWLMWSTYPYLGSMTGGTLSDGTVLQSMSTANEAVDFASYNVGYCKGQSGGFCIPNDTEFNDSLIVYRRINRGLDLDFGFQDWRSNGVPFDQANLNNSANSGPGTFNGGDTNYIVINVIDESDGLVGLYTGSFDKTTTEQFPFRVAGNGWTSTVDNYVTNRVEWDYEMYIQVYEDIRNQNGKVNGLLYPVTTANNAKYPFVPHAVGIVEGETISQSDYLTKYGENMDDVGPESINLTGLTQTNAFTAFTTNSVYLGLDSQYQNGVGLKNFGFVADPSVTGFTPSFVSERLNSFFETTDLSQGYGYNYNGTCYEFTNQVTASPIVTIEYSAITENMCDTAPCICPSPTPTQTQTTTPTQTPTPTETPSVTQPVTPTQTQTSSVTPTPTQTQTNTLTPTPTYTPSQTVSQTPGGTPPVTPTQTQTNTLTPTYTPSVTGSLTPTPTPSPSDSVLCVEATTNGTYYYTDCCGFYRAGQSVGEVVPVDTNEPYSGLTINGTPTTQDCDLGDLDYDFSTTGTCEDVNGGVIVISPFNGVPPFTIDNILPGTLSGGTSNQPFTWTGLTEGTYTFRLNDSLGDSNNEIYINVNIDGCLSVDIDYSGTTCGQENGFVSISGDSTSLPYLITLYKDGLVYDTQSSGDNPTDYANLPNGDYYATVEDYGGATGQTSTVTVSGTSELDFGIAVTGTSSCGITEGSLSVTGLTGQSPYTYLWSNGQTGSTITGLSASTYSVTVTDANNCELTKTETVNASDNIKLLSYTTTPTSCLSEDGEVYVYISGGTAPYTYSGQNGHTGQTSNTNFVFTGCSSGDFTFTITDSNQCTLTDTVNVGDIGGITSVSARVDYINCGQLGVLTLDVVGNGGPYTYGYTGQTSGGTSSVTVSNGQYQFTNLIGDVYDYTVKTNNGCCYTGQTTITPTEKYGITVNTTGATCGGDTGVIEVIPLSGYTLPLDYILSDGQSIIDTTLSGYTFYNVPQGGYTVEVVDGDGCSVTQTVNVTGSTGVDVVITVTASTYTTPYTLSATTLSGEVPFTYLWSDGSTGTTITANTEGTYSVTVTDSEGCQDYASYSITDSKEVVDSFPIVQVCSDTFSEPTIKKRGFYEILNEGYLELMSDEGVTGCTLTTAIFNYTITYGSQSETDSFYTGTTLSDVPSDFYWESVLETVIGGFTGIESVDVDPINNNIKIVGECSDNNFVDIDVTIDYVLNCP